MTLNNFSKLNRLRSKSDFQNLRSGSRFFSSDLFVFYIKKNELEETRLGIAASKKFGNAVMRNKLKRLIRETFRTSDFKNKGYDVLVSVNYKNIKKDKMNYTEYFSRTKKSLENTLTSKLL